MDPIGNLLADLIEEVLLPAMSEEPCDFHGCGSVGMPSEDLEGSYCTRHEPLVRKAVQRMERQARS